MMPVVRQDEDRHARLAGRYTDPSQVGMQANRRGDLAKGWPHFAALRQEIVVGIDAKKRRLAGGVRPRFLEDRTDVRSLCKASKLGTGSFEKQ